MCRGGKGPLISEDKSLTFGCNNDQTLLINRINSTPDGISGAVSSKWAKGTGGPAGDECYNLVVEPQLYDMTHAVRRLTPLECLRLQGFPDYWLDIEGMSDTAKYRAIGNSIAVPCVDFIMESISEVLKDG